MWIRENKKENQELSLGRSLLSKRERDVFLLTMQGVVTPENYESDQDLNLCVCGKTKKQHNGTAQIYEPWRSTQFPYMPTYIN